MGEQIGIAVEGRLYYVPLTEFARVRRLRADRVARTAVFADMCRLNALYMIARAGSGHIGSSFSSLDIVSWLVLEAVQAPAPGGTGDGDLYFSSKGHDAPGYYSALIGAGRLDFDLLHRLRRIDGVPGHPDVGTPGIVTNTGSLGMGISKAKGMVRANRLRGRRGRVFVMTGDGELQEGQFWESLLSAANDGLHEITAIVDHNTLQSDTFVAQVSDLGDLEAKLRAFGWYVDRCDGHDLAAFSAALARATAVADRPQILIADTVKGRGVSFMEHTAMESDATLYRFHSGAPDSASYTRAAQELIERVRRGLAALGAPELVLETVDRPAVAGRRAAGTAPHPRLLAGVARGSGAGAAARRPRRRPRPRHRAHPLPRGPPGTLHRMRHRRAGHGVAGGRPGVAGPAAGGAFVRLLPHGAGERTDLQQRHGAHEDHLRGLAGGRGAGRPRPLAPGGA